MAEQNTPSLDPGEIDTLGKLADNGMGLVWYCDDCNRRLDLGLADAIARWGRDQVFIQWKPAIKCAGCGSRNVHARVQANVPRG
ncbi:hypothetical protein [Aurantimonas phage AmM-1]|uniref:hypothetical protein n=1 Tax=Aurantimonas phage AmM-1 TaxID=1503929 RepID=UPI000541033E|nr:hypothetical protein ACQ23_gp36 [Aurantimonas phage AmM-1]BAP94493.1 hypothetical protein [Aurantimonas phage AmM-1]